MGKPPPPPTPQSRNPHGFNNLLWGHFGQCFGQRGVDTRHEGLFEVKRIDEPHVFQDDLLLQLIKGDVGGGLVTVAVIAVEQALHHFFLTQGGLHDVGHILRFHPDIEQIDGGQADEGTLATKALAPGLFDERQDLRLEPLDLDGGLEGPGHLVCPLGQAARPQTDPDHRPLRVLFGE